MKAEWAKFLKRTGRSEDTCRRKCRDSSQNVCKDHTAGIHSRVPDKKRIWKGDRWDGGDHIDKDTQQETGDKLRDGSDCVGLEQKESGEEQGDAVDDFAFVSKGNQILSLGFHEVHTFESCFLLLASSNSHRD